MTMPSAIALRGMLSLLWTVRHQPDPGMPPSRAKAQVHREVAVTQPTPQMIPSTSRGMVRQKAPAELPIACLKMTGVGWAALMSRDSSGMTKQTGIRKRRPATKLMTIVPTMALGTMTAGSRTSSQRLARGVSIGIEFLSGANH